VGSAEKTTLATIRGDVMTAIPVASSSEEDMVSSILDLIMLATQPLNCAVRNTKGGRQSYT
jgi:hypothetical protein